MGKISDYPIAATPADDDYILLDGATNNTRKLLLQSLLGDNDYMKFKTVNSFDLAIERNTVYFVQGYFVICTLDGSDDSGQQYRFSDMFPRIQSRRISLDNGSVYSATEWTTIGKDSSSDVFTKFETVSSPDEAIEEGVLYKIVTSSAFDYAPNNCLCVITIGLARARQYLFNCYTGTIDSRFAPVNNGEIGQFGNWHDAIEDAVEDRMEKLTYHYGTGFSIPYDYNTSKPDVTDSLFLALSVGQIFFSVVQIGNVASRTYWIKSSSNTCDAFGYVPDEEGDHDYYTKDEANARFASLSEVLRRMLLADPNTIFVPSNSAGTAPNVANSNFLALSVGQVFTCFLNGETTYWIKVNSSLCKRFDNLSVDDILSPSSVSRLRMCGYIVWFMDYDPPSQFRENNGGSTINPLPVNEPWLWIDFYGGVIYKSTSITYDHSDAVFDYYNVSWISFMTNKMNLLMEDSSTTGLTGIPLGQLFKHNTGHGYDYYIRENSSPVLGSQTKLAKYSDITNALGTVETLLSQV